MCSAKSAEWNTPSPNEICHLRTKPNKSTLYGALFFVFCSKWTKKSAISVVFTIIDGGKNHGRVHDDETLINDLRRDTENIYNLCMLLNVDIPLFLLCEYQTVWEWYRLERLKRKKRKSKKEKSRIHCTRKRLFIMNKKQHRW